MVRTSGPFLALRAQGRVHRPQRALTGRRRARPHEVGRQGGGGTDGPCLLDALARLGHEDDVHVADVVELASSGLAHADHGEVAQVGVLPDVLPRDLQRSLEGRLGEVGQRGRRLGQGGRGVGGGQVEGRDPEELAAVPDAQGVVGGAVTGVLHGVDEFLDPLGRRAGPGLGDAAPVLGVGDEVVGQRREPPEHRQQPVTGGPGVPAGAPTSPLACARRPTLRRAAWARWRAATP